VSIKSRSEQLNGEFSSHVFEKDAKLRLHLHSEGELRLIFDNEMQAVAETLRVALVPEFLPFGDFYTGYTCSSGTYLVTKGTVAGGCKTRGSLGAPFIAFDINPNSL